MFNDRLRAHRQADGLSRIADDDDDRDCGDHGDPGGRVCVLELGVPRSGLLAPLARIHVRFIVPLLGRLFAGKDEYRYLQESVEGFPSPDEFAALMAENGLRDVTIQPQSFGAAHLYTGIVA